MRPCPSCRSLVAGGRVVCESCGHDLGSAKNDGAYGRGAIALLRTRAGVRLIAIIVGVSIAVGGMALGVSEHTLILGTLIVFGAFALYAIVSIFRT